MRKKYRPTAYADKVASIGIAAAAEFAPGLLSTRVGLPFGSKFVFDDIWHDFKVNVPGQMGARRLLQFPLPGAALRAPVRARDEARDAERSHRAL